MVRADGHGQRVNDNVFHRDAQLGGAFDDLGRHDQAFLRVHGDAVIINDQADNRHAELLDHGQDVG